MHGGMSLSQVKKRSFRSQQQKERLVTVEKSWHLHAIWLQN